MKHGTMSLRDRAAAWAFALFSAAALLAVAAQVFLGARPLQGMLPPLDQVTEFYVSPSHEDMVRFTVEENGLVQALGCGWPGGGPIRPSAMSGGSIPIISICSAPTSPWGMWSCMRTVFSASRGASSGWRRERPTSGVWSCAGRPCHERAGQYTLAIRNNASYAGTGTVEYWETDDSPCH